MYCEFQVLILTRVKRLEKRLCRPYIALSIIGLRASGIRCRILLYHFPPDSLLKAGMQELMDAAYRLRGNILAPTFANRRHDSFSFQKLLIIAFYDARGDFCHFQLTYQRVDVVLYKGSIRCIGRHCPIGLTVYGNILLEQFLHGDAYRYGQRPCGFLILDLFLPLISFRLSLEGFPFLFAFA